MMLRMLRTLLLCAGVAVLLMAALDTWIRVEPIAMTPALQVGLSVVLVVVLAALLALVLRMERESGQ
jgi:hypothetical protein